MMVSLQKEFLSLFLKRWDIVQYQRRNSKWISIVWSRLKMSTDALIQFFLLLKGCSNLFRFMVKTLLATMRCTYVPGAFLSTLPSPAHHCSKHFDSSCSSIIIYFFSNSYTLCRINLDVRQFLLGGID